ncbi:unnamed protein product [Cuscuta campestris]|uniref:Uncharacterized protein n=1 Tax=Cuscuta campestris TaxID=132261 RepID=A0A484LNL6_9ASTE|nr:unnamed protein product [Cuscuta campestris]
MMDMHTSCSTKFLFRIAKYFPPSDRFTGRRITKPPFSRAMMTGKPLGNGWWQRGDFCLLYGYGNGLRLSAVLNCSKSAKATEEESTCGLEKHFLVDFLTASSLSFSQGDAISVAAKVTTSKPRTKPDLVVDYLKTIGLEPAHIKAVVSKHPKLLLSDPEKTIRPKIQCLQELGLSGSDLANFIVRDASFLFRGLDTHLRPSIRFLKQVAGGNDNAVKALKRSGRFLSFGRPDRMEEHVRLLRDYGIPEDKIQWFVVARPNVLTKTPDWTRKMLNTVETEIGLSRNSPMFYSGLCVASQMTMSTVNRKVDMFRSLGWSKPQISTLVQKQPHCLMLSEAKLRMKLNFLMKELGYGPHYLADRPMLIMSSLEKKTIPRSRVLKTLEERKLSVCSLFTSLFFTESRFSARFLLPYKDELPDMYDRYMASIAP